MTQVHDLRNPAQITAYVRASLVASYKPVHKQLVLGKFEDPDSVHYFRIGLRQLLVTLRVFHPVFVNAKLASQTVKTVEKLLEKAQTVRDFDVVNALVHEVYPNSKIAQTSMEKALGATLLPDRERAQSELHSFLVSDRVALLSNQMAQLSHKSNLGLKSLAELETRLHTENSRLWRKVKSQVNDKNLESYSAKKIHKLRLKTKYARYLTELLKNVSGFAVTRRNGAYVKLQGVLGDISDLWMLEAWLRRNERVLETEGLHAKRLARTVKSLRKSRTKQLGRVKELF